MFVFYDTETTGTNRDFDQILQFAAILTDDDLNEVERFEIRCRCLPWVVPAPMALKVTSVSPDDLSDPALPSHYEMMSAIHSKLTEWPRAVYAGYNSIRFDEPLLQRALWLNLHPPYHTVTSGNARLDILTLAQAASHLAEGALSYPATHTGRTGFRLDALAPLNGFAHENAHDALADVEATIHIAKLLKERAPALWEHAVAHAGKSETSALMPFGQPVLICEYFGAPYKWWGVRIDKEGHKARAASVARLDCNWPSILSERDDVIADELELSPRPVRDIALNKAPVIYTAGQAQTLWNEDLPTDLTARAAYLRENPKFCDRILEIKEAAGEDWPAPEHLEQRMFEGFASREDETLMRKFHASLWPERAALINSFEDARFRQIAQRLVFDNAPHCLNDASLQTMRKAIADRLYDDSDEEGLWRTLSDAENDLEDIRSAGDNTLADQITLWLQTRAAEYPLNAKARLQPG